MHKHAIAKWNFVGNIVLSLTLATLLLGGFKAQQPAVLSVERLNIVDSAGHLALVISNAARLPGVTLSGVEHARPRGRVGSAGMLFFNAAGDEVGGLIYKGGPSAPTDSNRAFGHLSLDQWKSNQVVVLQYLDNGTNRSAGLRIWDRPTGERAELLPVLERQMNASPRGPVRDSLIREYVRLEGSLRAFVGSANRVAALELGDVNGRVRIRLSVDTAGTARLAFLDTLGRVTTAYPAQ